PLPPMSPADNPEIRAAAAPKAKSARARLQEFRRGPPSNSSAAPPAKARPVPQHLPAAVSALSARRFPRRAKTAGLTAPSPQPARDNLPSPAHDCVRAAPGEIRRLVPGPRAKPERPCGGIRVRKHPPPAAPAPQKLRGKNRQKLRPV